jgi:hypothetical protein
VTPAANPDSAKVTRAIKNHEWFRWRCGDPTGGFHFGTNSSEGQVLQAPPDTRGLRGTKSGGGGYMFPEDVR